MRKLINFIGIIFIVGINFAQSTYLEVQYDATLDYEKTHIEPHLKGILKTDGSRSIFEMSFKESVQNKVSDSAYTSNSGAKIHVRNKVVYKKNKGFQTFKLNDINTNIGEQGINGKRYLVEDVLRFKWDIVPDSTKIILGYTTHLAKTHFRGRDYHAYFATSLPYNDGPYKFYGLPGLILEVKSTDSVIKFTAVGIKTVEQNLAFVKKLDALKKTYINRTLKRNEFVQTFKEKLKASAKYRKSKSSGSETYQAKFNSRSIEMDLYTDN